MTSHHHFPKPSSRKGSALLMAVLISSIVLTIGLGVYLRTYKELLFANFWTQSQVAFAAADSGLECALYFASRPSAPVNFNCFGGNSQTWVPVSPVGAVPGVWVMPELTTPSGGCAKVTITKWTLGTGPGNIAGVGGIITRIESRGNNDACGSSNLRRVERGIKLEW
ncbi:MAG: hypothetical protein UY07_C0012G0018 [Parcubacteria group bacterium GW2011_GWA1_47_8]|nr:MAG: hypothetical protein UY07_C0012G0018 [Parcubacteria group bacterium GW2011_GWA1_47_8]KKW07740.1 MAG: hypothetical protein UY42_C0007G0007 [Parcubacteria group bacterium GW2011_GWA2_49_16]